MPEIAEREPKVVSEGLRGLGEPYLGLVVPLWPAQRLRCPGESACASRAAGGLRKWRSLPRLETRTKESDTGASIVVSNHSAQ